MIENYQKVEKFDKSRLGIVTENATVYSINIEDSKVSKFSGVSILCFSGHGHPYRYDTSKANLCGRLEEKWFSTLPNNPGEVLRLPNSSKYFWLEKEDDDKAFEIFTNLLLEMESESLDKIKREIHKLSQFSDCARSVKESLCTKEDLK